MAGKPVTDGPRRATPGAGRRRPIYFANARERLNAAISLAKASSLARAAAREKLDLNSENSASPRPSTRTVSSVVPCASLIWQTRATVKAVAAR